MIDDNYYDYWDVKWNERYILYFDESGNPRKFWVNENTLAFNTDYNTDFVLAGIAFKNESPKDVSFEFIRDRIGLQKNVKEIKFNKQFKANNFLELMKNKRLYNVLQIIDELNAYIHFINVNNLYYSLVELLDSITEPVELEEYGLEYFMMKSVLYDTLYPEAERLQKVMCSYKYPNLIKESIPDFCEDIIHLFPAVYDIAT